MECYITYCVKGYFAFNSENELISEKLFQEDEIINKLAEINDKQIVTEELEIIDEVRSDYDEIIIESNKRSSDYNNDKVTIKTPNQAGNYLRSNYDKFGLSVLCHMYITRKSEPDLPGYLDRLRYPGFRNSKLINKKFLREQRQTRRR